MALERKPVLLGVDYGLVRVGLAVSDAAGLTAQPIGVFPAANAENLLAEMKRVMAERDIHKIVVGLPLNMDGSEGSSAKTARQFAAFAGERLDAEVVLWDERLSTYQADRSMLDRDLSRKKRDKRRDAIAAQFILQSYLDSQGR